MGQSTLVLTATITPPPEAPVLARSDPGERLKDYLQSLEYYLSMPGDAVGRIVFVENSNSDVTPLRELAAEKGGGKSVEFVSFDGLDHPARHGRAYGEFKLLDHAVGHSETLRSLGDGGAWWKVTGRYRLLNLARMLATAPASYELYCDMRDYPIPWMEVGLFSCTNRAYRRMFAGVYRELREDERNEAAEVTLRRMFDGYVKEPGVVPRFRAQPRVEGIRGKDNRNYAHGRNAAKFWLRMAARRVAPWVWI